MFEILNGSLVICPRYIKQKYLKQYGLLNTKFYTLNEFIEKYVYKYKPSTLFYLVKKYKLIPSNASVIMENLYYIDKVFNDKTKFLLEIKNDLISNKYIVFNKNFTQYILNKKIYIIGYPKTKYLLRVLKDANYSFVIEDVQNKDVDVFEFQTIDEETTFVATKIVELINSGVNINDIVVRYDKEYINSVNKIFTLFNIPYNVEEKLPLYYLDDTKKFLFEIDKNKTIAEQESFLKSLNIDTKICNKIISILDKYIDINPSINDFYDTLVFELQNTYLDPIKYNNCVVFLDPFDFDVEKKHVFLIGFNQNVLPKVYKDEDYLSDLEKNDLGIDNSSDQNKIEKEKVEKILSNNNIYVSYKLETPFEKYNPSSLIDELNYAILHEEYNFTNLEINEMLFAYKLDDFLKYNILSKDINDLYTNVEIPYKTYSNKYQKINLKNENINLSFTNIEQFFKCKFAFYLKYILKIDDFEETVNIKIGNMFHEILAEIYTLDTKNYEIIIQKNINKYFGQNTEKQMFYNKKYKKQILLVINLIDEHLKTSKLKNTYLEEWFSFSKNDFKIHGKIDKIMTSEENTVIIDYKTGFIHCDFNKIIHGIDMQLMFYLYLIKNSQKIPKIKFIGTFLMPIMCNVLKSEKNKTYDELLKKELKFQGYTTDNLNDLSLFGDVSFISSLSINKDSTFRKGSKVLNKNQIEMLLKIIDDKVEEVIESIQNNNFSINPKILGKENISCLFCKFKDVCFMTDNDLNYLKEYKNLEFLGGEAND